ncbi:MAG: glycosyltransferase family 2 protein [Nitrospirae bacterium]|nr:glycosyltransferase family 2 protein [Nitrospirota bacterium]MBF0533461.1 glycosyltransferase family 2 protein [Nitrospirota bacterium]MBF0616015.1 glycosyltransferase family 2 protein [Nitrospirota bacterium]
MLEEKLGISIITYNRDKYLDHTLSSVLNSIFKKCNITVYDNCSTDETQTVCEKYRSLFSNFVVIRHRLNIGGSANYLRAVENSDTEYTWILAAANDYDFEDVSEVVTAIEDGTYDMIVVGDQQPGEARNVQWRWNQRGVGKKAKELHMEGMKYFYHINSVPCIIFKTELFDSVCLQRGYECLSCNWPNAEFINKSIRDNFKVYICKKYLISG